MNTILTCVAMTILGVDAGWQPLPTGGMEYIIHVDPGTLELLKPDEPIQSWVDPQVRDVRRVRVVVSRDRPPRKAPLNLPPSPSAGGMGFGAPGAFQANPVVPSLTTPKGATPGTAKPEEAKTEAAATTGTESSQPWLLFWAIVLGLCASLSGNLFLGWIFMGTRKRYQAALKGTEEEEEEVEEERRR